MSPSIWGLERAKTLKVYAFLFLKAKTRIVHCLCDESPMTGNATCELHWQIAELLDEATKDLRLTIGGMEMEIAELRETPTDEIERARRKAEREDSR